jgi:hypothetical protein
MFAQVGRALGQDIWDHPCFSSQPARHTLRERPRVYLRKKPGWFYRASAAGAAKRVFVGAPGLRTAQVAGRREGTYTKAILEAECPNLPYPVIEVIEEQKRLSIEHLVDLAKLRWRIERDYQELKQELGLGHY